MAPLAQGIVGGEMAWPLVMVGILMGFALHPGPGAHRPMLVAVGMYLPLETTFAIFVGGMIKGIIDRIAARRISTRPRRYGSITSASCSPRA